MPNFRNKKLYFNEITAFKNYLTAFQLQFIASI